MFKKKTSNSEPGMQTTSEVVVTAETANLSELALSIHKRDGKWYLATFKYDPATGETGEYEAASHADGVDAVREQFKIIAANKFFSYEG
jgi:hypothetical protein